MNLRSYSNAKLFTCEIDLKSWEWRAARLPLFKAVHGDEVREPDKRRWERGQRIR